jgi:3'-5' exonuclease
MLENTKIENILFLDIETVPQYPDYDGLPEGMKKFWDKKAGYISKNDEDTPRSLFGRSGIYAEFGKIICISTGFIYEDTFRVKSFYGDDEKALLAEFAQMLNSFYNKPHHRLCGHNSKEFDVPYIARRMLINGITLPGILSLFGKKPWEIPHLDTMELWRFGDYKNFTSLDLLTTIFNIPSPKDDIDGSMVASVYYEEKDLPRIVEYCQRDTLAVAQLLLRYLGRPVIAPDKVEISKEK